jgi:hypothetical protein
VIPLSPHVSAQRSDGSDETNGEAWNRDDTKEVLQLDGTDELWEEMLPVYLASQIDPLVTFASADGILIKTSILKHRQE